MPRKFFRRFLPHPDSIRNHRYLSRFGPRLQHANLWCLNRRSVAGGVAAGLFAGLIPGSNPVQFGAGALLAVAFRVNLPIAVIVTLYSNPFTVVPLYFLAFKLGQLVLMQPGDTMPDVRQIFHDHSWHDWGTVLLDWAAHVGKPLVVGLPLLGALLAIGGYFLTSWAWQAHVLLAWRSRKRKRAT